MATSNQETRAVDSKFGWRQRLNEWMRFQNLQRLTTELGESAGPGLESAQAVVDFLGGAGEIGEAIFFFENGSQSGD